jgi:hypothetical protein
MCNQCRDANIKEGNSKFEVDSNGRLQAKYGFCPECVQANFECTDAWLRLNLRKRGQMENDWLSKTSYKKRKMGD